MTATDIDCPTCRTLPGRYCTPAGTVCAARVEAARSATTDADLLALVRDVPPLALRELVRVLRHGGAAKGCAPNESGGGQCAADHFAHACDHIEAIESYEDTDRETGALHLLHAAARLMLAAELVLGEGRK